LGRRTGIPYLDAIYRKKLTPSQATVSRAERRRNVRGAFAVRHPLRVKGKRVLLVDDVLTTGSTAGACAAALKKAGAAHVAVITIARVDRRAWVEPFITDRSRRATAS
jgi:predicted amidophosphoribosyltransferase